MPFVLAGNFMPPMNEQEKEQLFQETRTWYTFYDNCSRVIGRRFT